MSKPLTLDENTVLARSKLWVPSLDKLLRRWKDQIGKRQMGHARQGRKFSRRHYIIGIPATLLTAITTTGILSTFRNCDNCDDLNSPKCEADQWIRLAMGVIGIGAGSLSALMTFMNYQEASEQHKNAASDFENLHRVIETLLQVPGTVRGDPVSTLHNLRDQYTSLVRSAPQLPGKYAVDLTYNFNGTSGPKPPEPDHVSVAPLKKLLHDDDEVTIDFDLDSTQSAPVNQAALKAACLAADKECQAQQSLSKALNFELSRLSAHAESPYGSDSQSDSTDQSNYDSRGESQSDTQSIVGDVQSSDSS